MNSILALLFAYSIYSIWQIPQPYGIISLSILIISFLFNFIRNRKISILLYIVGSGGSLFVCVMAYLFISETNVKRDKFNISTVVSFEKSDFKNALTKAKNENKPIFVDFYTGWCGPCLMFTQTILTDKEVGKYMNKTFINLKYDAEKGEGVILSKKYNVMAYPTLLILDHNEKTVEEVTKNHSLPTKQSMIEISKKYDTIADQVNLKTAG
ncbi:MAG: thioredoxin family protein [Emticicia sp.]|nr:thioredoxin family protein [Emticicia sp.]